MKVDNGTQLEFYSDEELKNGGQISHFLDICNDRIFVDHVMEHLGHMQTICVYGWGGTHGEIHQLITDCLKDVRKLSQNSTSTDPRYLSRLGIQKGPKDN